MSDRDCGAALHPLIAARWSPLALTGAPLPREALLAMLEAARWAPSADNSQPWRFAYVLRDGKTWPQALDLLRPANRAWATDASALLIASALAVDANGKTLHAHAFDTGAACSQLALQAVALGWQAHIIGGFDRPAAAALLARAGLADGAAPQVMIAIGKSSAARIGASTRRALAELTADLDAPTP